MVKVKKIPTRMCVGCNEMKEKKQLVRVVKTPDNSYVIDRTGKKSGRGAYICPNKACLEKAIKSKGLERSFKEKIPSQTISEIKEEFLGETNGR
ncbi:MAG: YlxR family protein [Clostridia bacterium]|nr:YlxR family protein [Clostridia bacterium]